MRTAGSPFLLLRQRVSPREIAALRPNKLTANEAGGRVVRAHSTPALINLLLKTHQHPNRWAAAKSLTISGAEHPARALLSGKYPLGVISADDGSSSHLRTLSRGGLAGCVWGVRGSFKCIIPRALCRMDGVRPGSTKKCLIPRHARLTERMESARPAPPRDTLCAAGEDYALSTYSYFTLSDCAPLAQPRTPQFISKPRPIQKAATSSDEYFFVTFKVKSFSLFDTEVPEETLVM